MIFKMKRSIHITNDFKKYKAPLFLVHRGALLRVKKFECKFIIIPICHRGLVVNFPNHFHDQH